VPQRENPRNFQMRDSGTLRNTKLTEGRPQVNTQTEFKAPARTESMKKRQGSRHHERRHPSETSGPRHTKLTLRQRQFIDAKLQGRSSAAAARAAKYAESVARKADEIISGSPQVQAAMAEILRAAGITDELLADCIWQGLNATVVSK